MTAKTKRIIGTVGLLFIIVTPQLLNEYEAKKFSTRLNVFSILFLLVTLANWTIADDKDDKDDED